jgi:hypothetical protein
MVPPHGLGNRLNEMHAWHRARGISSFNGQSRYEERNWERYEYIKWCFADAETADAFAAEFGGARI